VWKWTRNIAPEGIGVTESFGGRQEAVWGWQRRDRGDIIAMRGQRAEPEEAIVVWWVENDHADMELQRELASDVIHEAPSRIASIFSVAKEGRGFSSIILTGGQGSVSSLRAARLRLMAIRVPMRQPNATVLRTAMVEE
jgi:hypothetical protein